jgi:hypothetical protein
MYPGQILRCPYGKIFDIPAKSHNQVLGQILLKLATNELAIKW